MAFVGVGFAALGSGRWEARLAVEAGETAVVRIGEVAGVMPVTGAEFPVATVVALPSGWAQVIPEDEYPLDVAEVGLCHGELKMVFWGDEAHRGRVEVEVEGRMVPAWCWARSEGWAAPLNGEATRWSGDLRIRNRIREFLK